MSSTDYSMRKEITGAELNKVGLKALLNMGLNPNCKVVIYEITRHLIFYFLEKGDFASVELLIKKGADAKILNPQGDNLFHALFSDPELWNTQIFDLLISNKVGLTQLDRYNRSPLFCFLQKIRGKNDSFILQYLPFWRKLFVDGVDVSILGVDRSQNKTLITLAENIVDELRQQNVFVGEDGRKAEAEFKDLISHMQKMAKIKEEEDLKQRGAGKGDAKGLGEMKVVKEVNQELKSLQEGKVDVHKLDRLGRNLLHLKLNHLALFSSGKHASFFCEQHEDCPKIVDEILKRGVDVNPVDKQGYTPLVFFFLTIVDLGVDRERTVSLLSNTLKPLVMKLIDAGLDLTGLVNCPAPKSTDFIGLTNLGVIERFYSEFRDKKVFEGEDGKKAEEQVVSLIEYMKAKTTEKLEQESSAMGKSEPKPRAKP